MRQHKRLSCVGGWEEGANLQRGDHGTESKNGSTVLHCRLVIKRSLSVQQQYGNLRGLSVEGLLSPLTLPGRENDIIPSHYIMSTALLPLKCHSTEFLLKAGPMCCADAWILDICSTIHVWASSLTEVLHYSSSKVNNAIKIGTVTMFNFCMGMRLTPPPFADSSPPPQWRAGWRGKVCSTWGCPWCSARSHPATRTPWEAHPLCPSSRYSCHYPATEKETWCELSQRKRSLRCISILRLGEERRYVLWWTAIL